MSTVELYEELPCAAYKDGKLHMTFDSRKAAAKHFLCSSSKISKAIIRKSKTTLNGEKYVFRNYNASGKA